MKTLKTIIPIGILLFTCLFAMGEKKQKSDTAGIAKIEQLMKSREFYIEVDHAFPTGQLFMLDTIATGRLPFFGRAYSTEYGQGGGIEFEKAKIENESFKVINKRKKHYIEYKFNVRNRNDVFNFYVEVYGNGKCSVNVTSNNRASISYGGDLTPIPDDKRKALGI